METPATTPPRPRKRRRSPLACEQCRQRKIKCDRAQPCTHCLKAGLEPCVYLAVELAGPVAKVPRREGGGAQARSAASPARGDAPVPPMIPRCDGASKYLDRAGDGAGVLPAQMARPESLAESASSRSAADRLVERIRALEKELEETKRRAGEDSVRVGGLEQQTAANSNSIYSKSRLFGQSHWMNSTINFDTILRLKATVEADRGGELRSLMDQCKRVGRQIKAQHRVPQLTPQALREHVPPREVADPLVEAYLRTFETVVRILHVPTFKDEYERYWADPDAANATFEVRLLAVMAVGTCFLEHSASFAAAHLRATRWIHAVQAWLSSPHEKSRMNLAAVQVHCLVLLARLANATDAELIWISTGSLVRTAMQLGLHRDPRHIPGTSGCRAEMRRRLWHAVLEIALQSSLDSGGPPLVSPEDYDCEPPANVDDDGLECPDGERVESRPEGTFTQTSVAVALAKTLPVRLKITKTINGIRPSPSYEAVLALNSQLAEALRDNSISDCSSSGPLRPSRFQKATYDVLTQRVLMPLHRFFANKAASNPVYYYSHKVSLEVAVRFLEEVPAAAADADYRRLICRGRGIWSGTLLLAALAVAAELTTQARRRGDVFAAGATNAAVPARLRALLEGFVELMAERVRTGETNVKGHMFGKCILAHIDAMQRREEPEKGMMAAATASLEFCRGVLAARLVEEQRGQDQHGGGPTLAEGEQGGDWRFFGGHEAVASADDLMTPYKEFDWADLIPDTNLNFEMPEPWLLPNWLPKGVQF